jgi:hypothetical protein
MANESKTESKAAKKTGAPKAEAKAGQKGDAKASVKVAAKAKAAPEGNTKLAEFLKTKKLDARRVIAASRELEALRPEDRAIRRAKKAKPEGENAQKETRKPRSGRPVTQRAMMAALTGAEAISGPTKTRILRAVNFLLEQKKQEKVELRGLF